MFKSLFRRMAPLVAGALLLVQVLPAVAAYPLITGINWPASPNDAYCTVTVAPSPSSPHIAPKTASENYFWWFDGTRTYAQYSDHSVTANVYTGTQSVTVYVYGNDSSGNASWATSSRSSGVTIYNGP